jgi:maltose alpha-D-glucosyltransferase/alpha-amylase
MGNESSWMRRKEDPMANFAVGKEMYPELRRLLPPQLPAFLLQQRWFGGKARQIQMTELADVISIRGKTLEVLLLIVTVKYADGAEETYALPVSCAEERTSTKEMDSAQLRLESPRGGSALVLTDALKDEVFLSMLLEMVHRKATIEGEKGELRAVHTTAYATLCPNSTSVLKPRPIAAEQSNSSIVYGDRLILKFFRRLEEGINPDLEVGAFLTEKARFPHVPQLAGSLEYHTRSGRQMAQGILQGFVPNQGDAWRYTLRLLSEFYQGAAKHLGEDLHPDHNHPNVRRKERELPEFARASVSSYVTAAGLLGQRTAEMHLALASEPHDPAFRPERFTMEFQRVLERSLLELTGRVFGLLRERASSLPVAWRSKAAELASREDDIVRRFQSALSKPIDATRIRIHGDYHLGQVLYTGSDFVIIDFEGEPARPLAERRNKRSPLQDVAGMLRSFHYAAFAPLLAPVGDRPVPAEEIGQLSSWAEAWNAWVAERFLASYFAISGRASYLPGSRQETQTVLELHLLEKAIYELGYELNNRPTWVGIPLQGISRLLSAY